MGYGFCEPITNYQKIIKKYGKKENPPENDFKPLESSDIWLPLNFIVAF